MTRRDPQAGKLHRRTTRQEKPILFIGTALLVIFYDHLTLGMAAAIVSAVVILSWVVNKIEDGREYKDE